jgi:hypothetical protein
LLKASLTLRRPGFADDLQGQRIQERHIRRRGNRAFTMKAPREPGWLCSLSSR